MDEDEEKFVGERYGLHDEKYLELIKSAGPTRPAWVRWMHGGQLPPTNLYQVFWQPRGWLPTNELVDVSKGPRFFKGKSIDQLQPRPIPARPGWYKIEGLDPPGPDWREHVWKQQAYDFKQRKNVIVSTWFGIRNVWVEAANGVPAHWEERFPNCDEEGNPVCGKYLYLAEAVAVYKKYLEETLPAWRFNQIEWPILEDGQKSVYIDGPNGKVLLEEGYKMVLHSFNDQDPYLLPNWVGYRVPHQYRPGLQGPPDDGECPHKYCLDSYDACWSIFEKGYGWTHLTRWSGYGDEQNRFGDYVAASPTEMSYRWGYISVVALWEFTEAQGEWAFELKFDSGWKLLFVWCHKHVVRLVHGSLLGATEEFAGYVNNPYRKHQPQNCWDLIDAITAAGWNPNWFSDPSGRGSLVDFCEAGGTREEQAKEPVPFEFRNYSTWGEATAPLSQGHSIPKSSPIYDPRVGDNDLIDHAPFPTKNHNFTPLENWFYNLDDKELDEPEPSIAVDAGNGNEYIVVKGQDIDSPGEEGWSYSPYRGNTQGEWDFTGFSPDPDESSQAQMDRDSRGVEFW